MATVLELLKYILPSLIVFLTAYFLVRSLLLNDRRKEKLNIILNNQKVITPVRLQAYERMAIFLERISLENLLPRVHNKGMTNQQLQSKLVGMIKEEYDHNLSQQIYISSEIWQYIRKAKENTINLVNTQAGKIDPNAPSISLSKALLEHLMEINETPAQVALENLKKEVRNIF
jgi:uncharacterized protein YjaZ